MTIVRGQFQHFLAPKVWGRLMMVDDYGIYQKPIHTIDFPVYPDPGRDGILLPPAINFYGYDYESSEFTFFTHLNDVEVKPIVKATPITNGSLIGEPYIEPETLYFWQLAMDENWRQNTVKKEKCSAHWRQRDMICTRPLGHEGTHQGKSQRGHTLMWTDADMVVVRKKSETALVGWRVWKCVKGPRLKSVTADRTWESPVMRTKPGTIPSSHLEGTTIYGQSNGHQLPHPKTKEYDYGVYAYKTPLLCWERLLEPDQRRDQRYGMEPQYLVIGSMDLSGVVIEHELGYRAEIATVRELWYISNDFADALGEGLRRAQELGEFYKCDCHLLPPGQLKAWAQYYTGEV